MRKSKVDLRAANNAKIDVQGVKDATISALSPSGERFKTTSRVYIVRNVDKVYLSLDVLVGLRIVNEFFLWRALETNTVPRQARGAAQEQSPNSSRTHCTA